MSITLDIARASMARSELKVKQAVDISMMKKSMELQETQLQALVNQLPNVAALSGSKIDTKA